MHIQHAIAALAAAVADIAVLEGVVKQRALIAGGVGDGVAEAGRAAVACDGGEADGAAIRQQGHAAIRGAAELELETGKRGLHVAHQRVEVDVQGRAHSGAQRGAIRHRRIGHIDTIYKAGAREAVGVRGGRFEVMRATTQREGERVRRGGVGAEQGLAIVKSHAGDGAIGGDGLGGQRHVSRTGKQRAIGGRGETDLRRRAAVAECELRAVRRGGVLLGAVGDVAVSGRCAGIHFERHQTAGGHRAGHIHATGGQRHRGPGAQHRASSGLVVPGDATRAGLDPTVVVHLCHRMHTGRGGAEAGQLEGGTQQGTTACRHVETQKAFAIEAGAALFDDERGRGAEIGIHRRSGVIHIAVGHGREIHGLRRQLVKAGLEGPALRVGGADAERDARRALRDGDARVRADQRAAVERDLEVDRRGVELGGIAHAHVDERAVLPHQHTGSFARGDAADALRGIGPKVRRRDPEVALAHGLDVGVVGQHADMRRGGVVTGAGGVAAGQQHVLIRGAAGIAAVLQGEAQKVPHDRRGGAVLVDVTPRAGAGLAHGFDRGGRGEVVANVRARDVPGQVRPARAAHRLRPAERRRFGGAVHGEGVVAGAADLPLLDRGLDGPRVGAGDARAQAHDLVVKHEPRLLPREGDPHALELHARRAIRAQRGTAHPRMRRARALPLPARAERGGLVRQLGVRDIGGDPRQPVVVHRGMISVRKRHEIPVVERRLAVAGEPAAQVLAVDGFKVRDPRGAHRQAKAVPRPQVDDTVHLRKRVVRDQLPPWRDARVVHQRLRQPQRGQTAAGDKVPRVVLLRPLLDHALHAQGVRRRGELRDLQDGVHHAVRIRRGTRAPGLPPAYQVKGIAVVDDRLIRVEDPAIKIRLRRIRHRPGGAAQPVQDRRHGADQARSIARRVGVVIVLDEAAVRVVAIAAGHIREHSAEGIPAERDLRAAFHQAAAHAHGAGFPHLVRLRHVRRRHLVVHRVHVVGALRAGELVVEQHADVRELDGRADFPVPPVPILRGGGTVAVGKHPVQRAHGVRQQRGVALQGAARRRVGQRHGAQPRVAAGDVRRLGRAGQITPQEGPPGRFVHGGPLAVRRVRDRTESGNHVRILRVVAGAHDDVSPLQPQVVVLIGMDGGDEQEQQKNSARHGQPLGIPDAARFEKPRMQQRRSRRDRRRGDG